MSLPKSVIVCALVAALLSGCGVVAKPEAGTKNLRKQPGFYGQVTSLVPMREHCLRNDGFQVTRTSDPSQKVPVLQVGTAPSGPRLVIEPTAGVAEGMKIQGQAQGAELIGPVLLYPDAAPVAEMKKVEKCAAEGVT